MKSNNILNIFKKTSLVIPGSLLTYYKDLKITEKELVFLSYLMSTEGKIVFNVEIIAKAINYSIEDIMNSVSSLSEKKLINMVLEKNTNGMMVEYLDLSNLYNKLLAFVLEEKEEDNTKSNIYDVIEKEFGRTLSPIEYEIIKNWLDSGTNEELIKEALKEATFNGVNNLKYIDRILHDWNKKGFKSAKDIKRRKDIKEEKIDIFEYNWLDDNED